MERFAALYEVIDRTTSTNAKVDALAAYFQDAPPADAAWAVFFLTGRRLTRLLPAALLHEWTIELTQLPEWLVRESYGATGDFAEAVALLLDRRVQPLDPGQLRMPGLRGTARLPFDADPVVATSVEGVSLAEWIEQRLLPLRDQDDEERRVRVMAWWSRLDCWQLFVLNKLLTGEFRVGVSHTLVVRALAARAALPGTVIEHRLTGNWTPSADFFAALIAPEGVGDEPSRPYPFSLASPLDHPPDALGARDEWLIEWKWDGVRAQLIRRGEVFLWSRGDELIAERFPEVVEAARTLPAGTVLDGELLAGRGGAPRPFADLQQRIGRRRRVREVAADVPVVFVAFDLLEDAGADIRSRPLRERRARLVEVVARWAGVLNDRPVEGPARNGSSDERGGHPRSDAGEALQPRPRVAPDPGNRVIVLSDELAAASWQALVGLRQESRSRGVEGLMLKRWSSPYGAGRRKGDWWKWKIEPQTIDAVLVYAQPGSGRRASLFTDYTFGVWDGTELVPVAKAYSGLTDQEIDELDRWIRRHTTERFGPVSAVEPVHVFELGFERIARSARHRSGVALRFPRILRWRRDKAAGEADTLETLKALLATQDDSVSRG